MLTGREVGWDSWEERNGKPDHTRRSEGFGALGEQTHLGSAVGLVKVKVPKRDPKQSPCHHQGVFVCFVSIGVHALHILRSHRIYSAAHKNTRFFSCITPIKINKFEQKFQLMYLRKCVENISLFVTYSLLTAT